MTVSPAHNGDEMISPEVRGFWHWKSSRFYLTLIMGLVIYVHAMARATLSIGIVCMVNSTASRIRSGKTEISSNDTADDGNCAGQSGPGVDYQGEQTWTSTEQSLLFSSTYWSGVAVGLPAGMIADRYSAKTVVLCCLILKTIGCLFTPVAVTYGGLAPFVFLRFLMGLGGQAVINPAIAVIISRWFPSNERSTVIGLYTGGNQIAFITSMPFNAWLCQQRHFLSGWPTIFYASGLLTILAMIPWMLFVSDTPQKNRWISKTELNYIEHSLRLQQLGNAKKILKMIPWKRMLMSMAIWSCILGNFTATILSCTLESYIPTYFKQVLHLDLSRNGMLSAVPYIAQWVSKILFSMVSDLLKKKTTISHTWICRLSNCLNTFATGAFLMGCAYTDCTQAGLAVSLLAIANFLTSGQVTSYWTSVVTIAPPFTGIVNSLVRSSGQLASLIAPYIVGGIVVEGTAAEWRIVYFITVAGLVATGVQFLMCGSASVQPWAKLDEENHPPSSQCYASSIHPNGVLEDGLNLGLRRNLEKSEKTGLGASSSSCETVMTSVSSN